MSTLYLSAFLAKHPIAKGVVEQRIRERIHDWVMVAKPEVAERIRREVYEELDQDFWAEAERLYGDNA